MGLLDTLKGHYETLKAQASQAAEDVKGQLNAKRSALLNTPQASSALGATPEASSQTLTGGRRYRKKTRKASMKRRKTHRK